MVPTSPGASSRPSLSQGRRGPTGSEYFSINDDEPPNDPLAPLPPGFKYPRLMPFDPPAGR